MAKHKTTYKNVPEWGEIDQLVQVKDFLPKPEDLVAKTKLRKVTLSHANRLLVSGWLMVLLSKTVWFINILQGDI